ncbi:hypothetical protein COI76_15715 [Bacillus cereus]|nr:hypothetical protein COI76_15715 [Bacillus cereus]
MKSKKITVTHRGTYESIKQEQKNMMLPSNYPIPNNSFLRFLEDCEKEREIQKLVEYMIDNNCRLEQEALIYA